ncbi:polycystin-1-like protein 2 [Ylistrum balloti]|uniref:polycystin-1-like protein 2 n=1 Tax=Ylistrum balloti TaxID=509963 RepID=UPI002905B47D|nr:polycystin-1-like protein 2 [Ylistrum balloti]
MLDGISFLTCTVNNPTDCSLDSSKSMEYVNNTEERLLQFMTIVVNSPDSPDEIEVSKGNIVIATIKSKGALLDEMVTKYSSTLDIPYVRPDAVQFNNTELILYVISYNINKYTYVDNQRMINTGTTRTVIRDKNGKFIDLYSGDDQLEMVVDANDVMNDPSFWENITDVDNNNEFFLNASFHNNVDGALMNIRIKSIMPCVMNGYDASLNESIDSQTPVVNLSMEGGTDLTIYNKPSNLDITYRKQDLSIVFVPPENNLESMISLNMYFQCEACLQSAQMSFLIIKSSLVLQDDFDVAVKFVKEMIGVVTNTEFSLHVYETVFETAFPFSDRVTSGAAVNSYVANTAQISATTTCTTPNTNSTLSTTTVPSTNTGSTTTDAFAQVTEVRLDTALYNLTSYLTTNATWSRQQIAVIVTDGIFTSNFTYISLALNELRSRNVKILAVGYGVKSMTVINQLVETPTSWHTFQLSRDPEEDIETTDLQDFMSSFCYGNYGKLAFNSLRFGRVSALMLNETSNRWHISENIKMSGISMSTLTVTFKSNFLGTFGSNVFVIPPGVLNFDTLFVDFARKLEDTPYVLGVNVGCLVLMVILVIPLRYFDKKDLLKWDYLPLVDNPRRARYSYYLSFYTGFWSSSRLTSTPFIIVKGYKGITGTRAVNDGKRKMFERWTLGNFLLKTDRELGKLSEIEIWHDEQGDSPTLYLEKILIYDEFNDEKYTFLCGQWLSPERGDCKSKRTLYTANSELKDGSVLFGSNTRFNLFDDYLFLSLFKRPSASRFTRVQRCVCVFSMLFLSMLANAMWYRTSEGVEIYGIHLGPFSINYKSIYVGCMASLVTFIPGFLIAWIFRNRKVKVGTTFRDQYTKEVMNEGFLPWWFIFVGYVVAIIFLSSGATFTFFYSIDWGRETTIEWLVSFTFGTVQGILLMDPLKVVLLTLTIAFLCKRYAKKDLEGMAPVLVERSALEDKEATKADFINIDEANSFDEMSKPTSNNNKERAKFYKLMQLDRKLMMSARAIFIQSIYISIVAVICAHNSVWTSYLQNTVMEKSLTPINRINSTEDIWTWMRGQFSDFVFPKLLYNGDMRLNESRYYMADDVSYRMTSVRIRQIRVKGKCDIPSLLKDLLDICPPQYSADSMERIDYCEGWTTYNPKKCNGTEWTFTPEDKTNSLSIFGDHDIYGGGGYVKLLNQSMKEVRNDLYAMQIYDWIDRFTRLVVIEFVIYNPDSKLFSLPTITIEIPQTGGYYPKVTVKTARLYPYIDTFDFLVLGFQLIFLMVTFCRFLHWVYTTWQIGRRCFSLVSQWVYLISIVMSIAAIVFFIVRIDRTIYTVENLFNSNGEFLTFDIVDAMDIAFKACIGVELFIAVLNLLRPLTFNYNIYLMRTSIAMCYEDLMAFGLCIMVPMIGFAILCFVCLGSYQMDFRDFPAAFITLFRMLLAMVKVRDTFGEQELVLSFTFSVFLFVMTIVMVNFCISILNDAFSCVKNNKSMAKDVDTYDMELHKHFWRKIYNILKIFQRKQRKSNDPEEDFSGILGLSMVLDNQIFRIVSQLERAFQNEDKFEAKYNSMMQKMQSKYHRKRHIYGHENTFSLQIDNIQEESENDINSIDYNYDHV